MDLPKQLQRLADWALRFFGKPTSPDWYQSHKKFLARNYFSFIWYNYVTNIKTKKMLLQLQIQIKIYYKSVFHSFHSQMLLVWLRNFCLIVSVTLIYLPCFYFYFEPRQDSFVKKFMEKCIFLLHVFVLVFPIP